jgi:hypothetical protein
MKRILLLALGMIVVPLFLAAAALGQGTAPPGPPAEPSANASEPGPPGWPHHAMGEDRPRFMRQFERMTPEQICRERFARLSGYLGYLGAELDLNAQQQPLWDAYQRAMLDAAGKGRQVCLQNMMTPDSNLTALERRDRFQRMLQARLDFLQATRQPLEALYQSLSPEQRRLVDRPFMGTDMERWRSRSWRND